MALSAKNATIFDKNSIALAASNLTAGLTVNAQNDITQSAPIVVGESALASLVASGDIRLTNIGNSIGDLSFYGNNVEIANTGLLNLNAAGSYAAGTLTLTVDGDIKQSSSATGGITVEGETTVTAVGKEVNLLSGDDANKNFSPINDFQGAVAVTAKKLRIGNGGGLIFGDVSLSGTGAGNYSMYAYAEGNQSQKTGTRINILDGSLASFATGLDTDGLGINLNSPTNSFGSKIILYSKGEGVHAITLNDAAAGSALELLVSSLRTSAGTTVDLSTIISGRGVNANFAGYNQPGSLTKFSSIDITCNGNLTQSRSILVTNAAEPNVILNVGTGNNIILSTGLYNQLHKIIVTAGHVSIVNLLPAKVVDEQVDGTKTYDFDL